MEVFFEQFSGLNSSVHINVPKYEGNCFEDEIYFSAMNNMDPLEELILCSNDNNHNNNNDINYNNYNNDSLFLTPPLYPQDDFSIYNNEVESEGDNNVPPPPYSFPTNGFTLNNNQYQAVDVFKDQISEEESWKSFLLSVNNTVEEPKTMDPKCLHIHLDKSSHIEVEQKKVKKVKDERKEFSFEFLVKGGKNKAFVREEHFLKFLPEKVGKSRELILITPPYLFTQFENIKLFVTLVQLNETKEGSSSLHLSDVTHQKTSKTKKIIHKNEIEIEVKSEFTSCFLVANWVKETDTPIYNIKISAVCDDKEFIRFYDQQITIGGHNVESRLKDKLLGITRPKKRKADDNSSPVLKSSNKSRNKKRKTSK